MKKSQSNKKRKRNGSSTNQPNKRIRTNDTDEGGHKFFPCQASTITNQLAIFVIYAVDISNWQFQNPRQHSSQVENLCIALVACYSKNRNIASLDWPLSPLMQLIENGLSPENFQSMARFLQENIPQWIADPPYPYSPPSVPPTLTSFREDDFHLAAILKPFPHVWFNSALLSADPRITLQRKLMRSWEAEQQLQRDLPSIVIVKNSPTSAFYKHHVWAANNSSFELKNNSETRSYSLTTIDFFQKTPNFAGTPSSSSSPSPSPPSPLERNWYCRIQLNRTWYLKQRGATPIQCNSPFKFPSGVNDEAPDSFIFYCTYVYTDSKNVLPDTPRSSGIA